jgi:hypothetical protein
MNFELSKCIPIIFILGIFAIYLFENAFAENVNNNGLSPLKQFDSGIAVKNITCINNLTVIIKAEDGSPACVKPQTAFKLIERGWGSLVIFTTQIKNIVGTQLFANYTITNGKILDITTSTSWIGVTVTTQTSNDGNLNIMLPQELFKIPKGYSHYAGLDVLRDGLENEFKVIKTTPTEITLLIPFVNGTQKILILGTYY